MKKHKIEIRVSLYEKKLIKKNAELAGLNVSEFCRRSVNNQKIVERFSEEQIVLYKSLLVLHNNIKSISNLFVKKDPRFNTEVKELADLLKHHLQSFKV